MSDITTTNLGALAAAVAGGPVFAAEGDHTLTTTVTGAGAVSATVAWQGSNDGVGWVTIATLTPSGTAVGAAQASTTSSYRYWRQLVSALTGSQVSSVVATEAAGQSAAPVSQYGNSTLVPYTFGSDGDSRANDVGGTQSASPTPDGTGSLFTMNKADTWMLAYLGDFVQAVNCGVSGDTTNTVGVGSGWNNPARSQGKTQAAFAAAAPQGSTSQYGINNYYTANDVPATYAAKRDQAVSDIKAFIRSKLFLGCKHLHESTYHCSQAGYGTDAASKRDLTNEINAQVEAWIATLPADRVGYFNANALLVDAQGYGDASKFLDGVHLNQHGGRIVGKGRAAAMRRLFPDRGARTYAELPTRPNLIWPVPSLLTNAVVRGTFSGITMTAGSENGRPYVDLAWTVSALDSGTDAQIRFEIHASVGSYNSTVPDATVANGDWLRHRATLVIGQNVANAMTRHRVYKQAGGSLFADWGDAGYVSDGGLPSGETFTPVSPKFQLDVGSTGIEAPAVGKGCAIHVFVRSNATGAGSLRVYDPDIRKVA
ncbi:hypothetical protein [Roseateles sp. P5_E7]